MYVPMRKEGYKSTVSLFANDTKTLAMEEFQCKSTVENSEGGGYRQLRETTFAKESIGYYTGSLKETAE